MRCASLHTVALFGQLFGCTDPTDPPLGLDFVDRAPVQAPTATLVSPEIDDGFGSALAVFDDTVWVGAPHGAEGRVYRWSSDDMSVALSGPDRLGAHLSSTDDTLLVSVPLADRVVNQEGLEVQAGQASMGIALSNDGDVAWAGGWRAVDGTEGTSPGRPSALHRDGGVLAVGMAHGPVALAVGEQELMRPQPGDEAGFSLISAHLDEQDAWIVGAPASNRVLGVRKSDLSILREWTGTGRFGHAITVTDLDGDAQPDLVVGSPYDGQSGSVVWFSSMGSTPQSLSDDFSEARGVGTALVTDKSRLIIGAPGTPFVPGRVIMVPLPL